jgi:hypothetical protein
MLLNALIKKEADRKRIKTAAMADMIFIYENWRKFLLIICRAPVTSIITTNVNNRNTKIMAPVIASSRRERACDLDSGDFIFINKKESPGMLNSPFT